MTILTAPGSVHTDLAGYNLYFGMGQRITLIDDPKVFRVSPAGEAFGSLIARRFGGRNRDARFLDLGTGSGVHALLLRQLGMRNVTASDISLEAVQAARANELVNQGESCIEFVHGDLFEAVLPAGGGFDVILFNPPGWQTPSAAFLNALQRTEAAQGLALEAMFYGEQTLRRFFERVPSYLKPGGKLIIGLNSLVDIAGVMRDLYDTHEERFKIDWSLLERHEIPLVLYTEQWRALQGLLHEEIGRWTSQGRAHCRFDDSGVLFWSYEIIEFSFTPLDE
ncbi:class I SAM-dependent methyltransferase [Pseudomonas sp. M5]|uniref:methyltransferase n=1 Tax=Pseudomonas sp. M5 TaxID=1620788 RepID=UPI0018CB2D21|nr:class I SAM-dependent methyltransferase [Pseudomonas sp. M5]MBM7395513.1 release factor glutamine methyltransferase [Pseudomonas sp. M5]QPN47416.1 class I SAM-dependent methyltransferase [Priestia aryabhattai]HDS1758838.1 class I SAM-dependent methyltransferase [Pseudomonas putida]